MSVDETQEQVEQIEVEVDDNVQEDDIEESELQYVAKDNDI